MCGHRAQTLLVLRSPQLSITSGPQLSCGLQTIRELLACKQRVSDAISVKTLVRRSPVSQESDLVLYRSCGIGSAPGSKNDLYVFHHWLSGWSLIAGLEYGMERWNGKWNGTMNVQIATNSCNWHCSI